MANFSPAMAVVMMVVVRLQLCRAPTAFQKNIYPSDVEMSDIVKELMKDDKFEKKNVNFPSGDMRIVGVHTVQKVADTWVTDIELSVAGNAPSYFMVNRQEGFAGQFLAMVRIYVRKVKKNCEIEMVKDSVQLYKLSIGNANEIQKDALERTTFAAALQNAVENKVGEAVSIVSQRAKSTRSLSNIADNNCMKSDDGTPARDIYVKQ